MSQAQAPGPAFGQHTSLFVPSTPTQQPEFVPASQLGYPHQQQQQQQPQQQGRSHSFGGQPPSAAAAAPPPLSQQQPSTIMVSSATSALMSTNIKAPGPSHAPGPVGHASAFNAGTSLQTISILICPKSCGVYRPAIHSDFIPEI